MRAVLISILVLAFLPAHAADWPQWGRDGSRNMASPEKGLPATFEAGKRKKGTDDIDPKTTKGVRWVAKLGSQAARRELAIRQVLANRVAGKLRAPGYLANRYPFAQMPASNYTQ